MGQKICCGGFELGEGLELDGKILKSTGGGGGGSEQVFVQFIQKENDEENDEFELNPEDFDKLKDAIINKKYCIAWYYFNENQPFYLPLMSGDVYEGDAGFKAEFGALYYNDRYALTYDYDATTEDADIYFEEEINAAKAFVAGQAVADAVGETTTASEFNALLASLRNAGIIKRN